MMKFKLLLVFLLISFYSFSQSPNFYLEAGKLKQAKLEYKESINDFNYSVELNSLNAEVYYYRALSFIELEKIDSALIDLKKSIHLNSRNHEYYIALGDLYGKKKKYRLAIKYFRKYLEINPLSDKSYYHMGAAYELLGRKKKALQCFNQAILINPNDECIYNDRGLLLANFKKYQNLAIKDFNTAISKDSELARFYDNRGNTYFDLKNYDEAINNYIVAINKDSLHENSLYMLSNSYYVIGDFENTLFYLNKLIDNYPNESYYYYLRSIVNSKLDKRMDICFDIFKAYSIKPSHRNKRQYDKKCNCDLLHTDSIYFSFSIPNYSIKLIDLKPYDYGKIVDSNQIDTIGYIFNFCDTSLKLDVGVAYLFNKGVVDVFGTFNEIPFTSQDNMFYLDLENYESNLRFNYKLNYSK